MPSPISPRAVTLELEELRIEGHGRWTRGDEVIELEPEQMIVVPPDTPHGFRNSGDVPLLVVSMHERGTLDQTWLGRDPA
jgi:mannose-6-phosphate isomerase-like protein (cupin superfamily)